MVWKDVDTVGFGIAGNWLVAKWCPGGNADGTFRENVIRPTDWVSAELWTVYD